MSTFKHKKANQTFKVTVSCVQEGLWKRYIAVTTCPLCRNELKCGNSGRIQKETEVKSSIKSSCNRHLWMVHHMK